MCLIHSSEHSFQLPKSISIHTLNKKRIFLGFRAYLKLVKQLQPDIIFSSLAHLNMMVLISRPFLAKNLKIFIREGSVVKENIKAEPHYKIMRFLYKHLYKTADKIICQSDFMIDELSSLFNLPKKKCIRIYNPVNFKHVLTSNSKIQQLQSPRLLSIGRLDTVKQFDLILHEIPNWIKEFPSLKYTIIGHGPQEAKLVALVGQLGISKYVSIVGSVVNPEPYLESCDCFILSSKYEGLPNALLEAISHKMALIVLDHPGGAREVLEQCGLSHVIVDKLKLSSSSLTRINDECYEKANALLNSNKICEQYVQLFNE